MTIQKKLFISLLAGSLITFGAPAHAGGFLGRLLGSAADMIVPGTGQLINDLVNESQPVVIQQQVTTEPVEQTSQQLEVPVTPQSQPISRPQSYSLTPDMASRWKAGVERECSKTTFSSAAFHACVQSRLGQLQGLQGTSVGDAMNGMMNSLQQQMDPALFNVMFPQSGGR